MKTDSPLIATAFKHPKGSPKTIVDGEITHYDDAVQKVPRAPTPHKMKVEAAHRAHRNVVEKWVAGETSTQKMKQSHSRLQHVVKSRGKLK